MAFSHDGFVGKPTAPWRYRIQIVYVFLAGMATHTSDVIARDCHCLDLIHGVDAVISMWMIQQESDHVFVGDNLGDGDAP
jgi:hypothetical protein